MVDFDNTPLNSTPFGNMLSSYPYFSGLPLRTKIIYWSISAFGLISNVFVIVVILLYVPMRKQLINTFIINQSVIDAAAAAMLCLTALVNGEGKRFTTGNIGDEILCRVLYSTALLWAMLVTSAYGMVVMTFEKFIAIVYPILYKNSFGDKEVVVKLMLTVPWLIFPLYNVCLNIPTSGINSEGVCIALAFWPSQAVRNGVAIFVLVVDYFVPLFSLIFCYARMAVVLHRRVEPSQDAANQGEARRNETMARARGNVIKTLALVGVLYCICWTPNTFYLLLNLFGYPYAKLEGDFYTFTVYMVFLNCCLNPVIYILKYNQFQAGIRHLLKRITIPIAKTVVTSSLHSEASYNA